MDPDKDTDKIVASIMRDYEVLATGLSFRVPWYDKDNNDQIKASRAMIIMFHIQNAVELVEKADAHAVTSKGLSKKFSKDLIEKLTEIKRLTCFSSQIK
jgi:hypothetical protein